MNLVELQQEVYSLTKRPDLITDTLVAIRAATFKMHGVDLWYKDMAQAVINLHSQDFVQQFDTTLLQRYKSMKFIRKWYSTGINVQTQAATGKAGPRMECVTVDEVLDSYGRDRNNVYYIAGTQVNMKSSDVLNTFLIGWYRYPDVGVNSFDSWIANEMPYTIVYDAAATVFKGIGFDEQSTRFGNMVAEQVAMLKIANIEAEGR